MEDISPASEIGVLYQDFEVLQIRQRRNVTSPTPASQVGKAFRASSQERRFLRSQSDRLKPETFAEVRDIYNKLGIAWYWWEQIAWRQ